MSASSIIGKKGTGVPTQLFHEGEGLTLTVETKTGIVYRGRADITEDNMNMTLRNAVATDVQGRQVRLDQVFVRGSQVMMVIYPDILKHAPMFERVRRVAAGKSVAAGLGKQRQQAIESKSEESAFGVLMQHWQQWTAGAIAQSTGARTAGTWYLRRLLASLWLCACSVMLLPAAGSAVSFVLPRVAYCHVPSSLAYSLRLSFSLTVQEGVVVARCLDSVRQWEVFLVAACP